MELTIDHADIFEPAHAGNKAATLARLVKAGFNVPAFFVLPGLDGSAADDVELRAAITASAVSLAGPDGRLAVRSSSAEEDGAQNSFAGQFATFLDITPDDVFEHAQRVVESGGSDHVRTYRDSTGASDAAPPPAVLVQRMIDADAAGVAFAADPVSGDTSVSTIAAIRGTGDALVSGEVQGDTWKVDSDGSIVDRKIVGQSTVLDDTEIMAVAELARSVTEFRGCPQDIEWAFFAGELFLLQSRDITTVSASEHQDVVGLWDNSNIVESYGGVTLPLTFSVAREAYEEAYRHMGRVLGIRESVIEANERCYAQMIGLIQGRVYYNLLNWYRLLKLTPGFRFNKGFMEQMMGVTSAVPTETIAEDDGDVRLSGVRAVADYLRISVRLGRRLMSHRRRVRRFHADLDHWLQPIDLDGLSLSELLDEYESLQASVIPAWDTPLVNDLFCMIFHGALKKLCAAWISADLDGIHNDLVAGEAAIISLEPVRRMLRMAEIARVDPEFVKLLQAAPPSVAEARIAGAPAFKREYDDYLERFGDRCLDELKLESETLRDDPTPLLRSIGQLATAPAREPVGDERRTEAEALVNRSLGGAPFRRRIFGIVLKLARAFVRDRENLRFERTRVYGRVRSVFIETGRRLVARDALDRETDVFYLSVDEVSAYIRGTGVCGDLRRLVALRREEFSEYRDAPNLPRRFLTRGAPQARRSLEYLPDEAVEHGDQRRGQACSRGVVRGQVRIVRDPRQTDFRQGEILVAERTDPGWVTIFPLVSGMIMERGSLLSHSAIVARELNIPAVVGVDNACSWLNDGEWVELDGATGVIRRLATTEEAA